MFLSATRYSFADTTTDVPASVDITPPVIGTSDQNVPMSVDITPAVQSASQIQANIATAYGTQPNAPTQGQSNLIWWIGGGLLLLMMFSKRGR